MPDSEARISARSRRQAMDWSLVLASQGIETTIQAPDESHGWCLIVPSNDSERAFKTLRQYRAENRGWTSWREELRWPLRSTFDWRTILWIALLAAFYWFSTSDSRAVTGGILNSEAFDSGQWWRVFTAMQLHADSNHLIANLTIGLVLFGLTMGQFGAGLGLLLPYFAGAAGNLVTLFVNGDHFNGLGASGMVMGALGMLAAQTAAISIRNRRISKGSFAGLAAGIMLFALYGTSRGSDIAAHFGGFVAGVVFGILAALLPQRLAQSRVTSAASIFIFASFLFVTWWLALHSVRKS